jgi:hypothetical protein
MDVHKPKPVQSWRELASEIGIIVISVLIALGAEQVVEILHWRQQVDQQEYALKQEVAANAGYFYERLEVSDCLRQRIGALKTKLMSASDTWQPAVSNAEKPSSPIYRVPWRNFPSQAWQSALTSGAVSHMSAERASLYGTIYIDVSDLHQMNLQEELDSQQLSDLDQPATLTDASRDRYLKTLDELRFYAGAATAISRESLSVIKSMGLMPPYVDLRSGLAENRLAFGKCVGSPKI